MNTIRISATIRDQVYQILKRDICEQYYKPGQWLQEKELAARLEVSRSPVREALRQLANDGLVVEIPNKGVFVREFSPDDIKDIFDMRIVMESYAIERSRENLTDDLVAELSETIMKLKAAYDIDDLKLYIEIDTHLHQQLINLGGNKLICSTYERLRSMLQPFRIYSLMDKERFKLSVKEHSDIAEFVIAGQPQKAIECNKAHLSLAQDAVMSHIRNTQAAGAKP